MASPAQAATLNRLTQLPINRSSSSGINVRDNILPDHLNDGLPAQFVYELADCRLYFTAPMITDVTAVWKGAAAAAFNGASCAAGSLPKRGVEIDIESREVNVEFVERSRDILRSREVHSTDAMWTARHGRKVIS
jgi:hypothetical protein